MLTVIFYVNVGYPVASSIFLLHLFLICASSANRPQVITSSLKPYHQQLLRHSLYLVILSIKRSYIFNHLYVTNNTAQVGHNHT